MAALAIYQDECVDFWLAQWLRERGFDVVTVQEAGNRSNDDEAQLLYATSQGRILLSHNQIHFRRLHAAFRREGRAHAGIALIPQTPPLSRLQTRAVLMLDWVPTFPDHHARLFTWGELGALDPGLPPTGPY